MFRKLIDFLRVPISIDITFFMYVALIVFQAGIVDGLMITTALFGSILAHEFGHVLMAKSRGIQTSSINLHLFGGTAGIQLDRNTSGLDELLVAIIGPVVSAILCLLSFVVEPYTGMALLHKFFSYLVWGNLMIAIFNSMPAFPLDGGRIFRGVLRISGVGFSKATKIAVYTSYVILFGAALGAIYTQNWLVLVLLGFIALAATATNKIEG